MPLPIRIKVSQLTGAQSMQQVLQMHIGLNNAIYTKESYE